MFLHNIFICRSLYIQRLAHLCYFIFLLAEMAPSNNTAVATSTPSTYILVSNTIFQQKDPQLLELVAVCRTGAGNIQNDPEPFYCARK